MHPLLARALTGVAFLLVVALPVRAEVTLDEVVCEAKADLAVWKFVAGKTACLVACERGVRSGDIDPGTCDPPYPPGSTAGCIQSKTGRTNGRICSVCNPNPPECYPEICSDTTTQLLTQVDDAYFSSFLPAIYCDEPDELTPVEGKCQDTIAKYLAKAAYARVRCYRKCRLNAAKGLFPPEGCVPPASDLATAACIDNYDEKAVLKIDRYCTAPYDTPECHGPSNGNGWVGLLGAAVDGFEPIFYCEQ